MNAKIALLLGATAIAMLLGAIYTTDPQRHEALLAGGSIISGMYVLALAFIDWRNHGS